MLLVVSLGFVTSSGSNNRQMYCWKAKMASVYETKQGTAIPVRFVSCYLKSQYVSREKFRFDISWTLNTSVTAEFDKDTIVHIGFTVSCLSSMELDFVNPPNIINKNVLLNLIFIGQCRVSMENLLAWAKATDLRALAFKGQKLTISSSANLTQQEGNETLVNVLKDISYIHVSQTKNIPSLFSNTKYVWPNLEGVELINMPIKGIPGQWKITMPYLQSLSLVYSNLTEPPEFPWNNSTLGIFRGLKRKDPQAIGGVQVERGLYIRQLRLDYNNIQDLSYHEFRGFLHVLRLKGNGLKKVGPSCFKRLEGIQMIDMSRNKLVSLPESLFRGLTSLRTVLLGKNNISFIKPNLYQGLNNIKRIYLDHNNLSSIPTGLFNSLNTLEVLRLDSNKITSLEESLFPRSSALRQLFLQNNSLSSIPSWIFRLRKIEVIDLSSNGLTFEDLDKALEAGYDIPMEEPLEKRPVVLYLENNNITRVVDSEGLDEIEANEWRAMYSNIWKAFSIKLTGNPLACDCIMSAVAKEIRKILKTNPEISLRFQTWQCDWPRGLKNKTILEIKEEQWMQREEPNNCPSTCFCQKRCSDGVTVVDCEENSLAEVPSSMPQGLIELDLRSNEIKDIPQYPYLINVTVLKLSNNKIAELQVSTLKKLKHIKTLLIDSNKLTSLPMEIEAMNFTTLAVDQNLFKCDCTTKWMKHWLLTNKHRIKNFQKVLCTSDQTLGQAMFNLSEDEFICRAANEKPRPQSEEKRFSTGTIMAIILGGLLLLMAIVAILLYKYHGEAKVFLFTHFNWHPFDRIDDSDPTKIYDAFISYSGDDHQWVVETLQKRLENHDSPYKLCFHHRDFCVGAPIVENILNSVDQSKRMLMVLSPSFARSEWCLLEFRTAHRKVIEDRMNYLIIILLDDVNMAELDEEIKLYMRTNTYVSYGDKWFWQKLFYAMPQQPAGESMKGENTELTSNQNNFPEAMQEEGAATLHDGDNIVLV